MIRPALGRAAVRAHHGRHAATSRTRGCTHDCPGGRRRGSCRRRAARGAQTKARPAASGTGSSAPIPIRRSWPASLSEAQAEPAGRAMSRADRLLLRRSEGGDRSPHRARCWPASPWAAFPGSCRCRHFEAVAELVTGRRCRVHHVRPGSRSASGRHPQVCGRGPRPHLRARSSSELLRVLRRRDPLLRSDAPRSARQAARERAKRRRSPDGRRVALIQAVLSLISRSVGKILTALFDWAVVALARPREADDAGSAALGLVGVDAPPTPFRPNRRGSAQGGRFLSPSCLHRMPARPWLIAPDARSRLPVRPGGDRRGVTTAAREKSGTRPGLSGVLRGFPSPRAGPSRFSSFWSPFPSCAWPRRYAGARTSTCHW